MPRKKLTVAIVDDSPLDRQLISYFLKFYKNCRVLFFATNGQDFLFKLREGAPDIVVLDLYMPIMDGWEVMEHLHASGYTGKILCVSNGYYSDKIARLQQLGVSAYCRKVKDYFDRAMVALAEDTTYFDEYYKDNTPVKEFPEYKMEFKGIETEIINYLLQGFNYAEISSKFLTHLTPKTIELYVQEMVKRFELKNKIELVMYAYLTGAVKFDSLEHLTQHMQQK